MNSPGMDVAETQRAITESGLKVDGTVCSSHWDIRHTSPSADDRAKALADLKTALRDTKKVGGDTVLLVVGHGKDGPEQEIWKRSQDNIAAALPAVGILFRNIVLVKKSIQRTSPDAKRPRRAGLITGMPAIRIEDMLMGKRFKIHIAENKRWTLLGRVNYLWWEVLDANAIVIR